MKMLEKLCEETNSCPCNAKEFLVTRICKCKKILDFQMNPDYQYSMTTILPVIDLGLFDHTNITADPLFLALAKHGAALTTFFYWYDSKSTTTVKDEERIIGILKAFKKQNPDFKMILDSGAFPIHNRKEQIKDEGKRAAKLAHYFDAYIKFLLRNNNHALFEEYYNLDIIGEAVPSEINLHAMVAAGLHKVAPVYHQGDNLDYEELDKCVKFANRSGKNGLVGLGGLVKDAKTPAQQWTEQIRDWLSKVTEVYPNQKFHALGVKSRQVLEVMHFDYADATSWTFQTAYKMHEVIVWDGNEIHEEKPRLIHGSLKRHYLAYLNRVNQTYKLNLTTGDLA